MDRLTGCSFVTGELGAGKTLFAIRQIQMYLDAGLPVASNLNLYMEHLELKMSKVSATRLPDKPSVYHLDSLGSAYDQSNGYDESKFGLLVLDECLTWLNSRGWQDKERAKVLDWFLHARKLGWNIIFLLQSLDHVDAQIRESLLTYHVSCRKLGKYKVPFLGVKLPAGTLATVQSGYGADAILYGREMYKGKEFYKAYDTAQRFFSGMEIMGNDFVDMRANYTQLSRWHIETRYIVDTDKPKVKYQPFGSFDDVNLLVRPFYQLSYFMLFLMFSLFHCIPAYHRLPFVLQSRKKHSRLKTSPFYRSIPKKCIA